MSLLGKAVVRHNQSCPTPAPSPEAHRTCILVRLALVTGPGGIGRGAVL